MTQSHILRLKVFYYVIILLNLRKENEIQEYATQKMKQLSGNKIINKRNISDITEIIENGVRIAL